MTHRRQIAMISIIALSSILFVGTPAWSQATDREANKREAATCDRAQFRVLLDVGHTAEVPGARSARNALEYDFNLRLAAEIERSLIAGGFTRTVLLVTHGPAMASLFKRVAAANQKAANLFLSIHHDSVPDSFLEGWEYEGKPSRFSDRFKGHSLFVSYENRALQASLLFGRMLGSQLKDRDLQFTRHYTQAFMGRHRYQLVDAEAGIYRHDKLEVLRSTGMPAVLLEAGSIINRDEEVRMNSPEHRDLIGAAVTTAVEMFCDARAPRPATPAAARAPRAATPVSRRQVP